ncbi:MAG: DNA-binding CsgD family transcriptional regulator [Cyclobacteriaceae bacterium]|jgi:DNA-binding CsgD family transcriptional regulator
MAEDNSPKNIGITNLKNLWRQEHKITHQVPSGFSLDVLHQISDFFAAGSYYYYIFNFNSLKMDYVSPDVHKVLGIEAIEFTLESMLGSIHPDDLEKMREKEKAASKFKYIKIPPDHIKDYKTVYVLRFLTKTGEVKKILHQSKAIEVSDDNRAARVLGVHTDISYLKAPIDHKISFISSKYPSYYSLDPSNLELEQQVNDRFTKQEVNIIELISKGHSGNEIADLLFISHHTVKTHKQNILRKSNAKNTVHLITNCIREGII